MNSATKSSTARRSRGFGPRKGWTLVELSIVMVILALLGAWGIPKYFAMVQRARETKAAQLEQAANKWYAEWSGAGGSHNATTTNEGSMALFLLSTVAGSEPTDAGIAKSADADGNWADETKLTIRGKSVAGALRHDWQGHTFTLDSTTNKCLYDKDCFVTFTPTATNKGKFTVTVNE